MMLRMSTRKTWKPSFRRPGGRPDERDTHAHTREHTTHNPVRPPAREVPQTEPPKSATKPGEWRPEWTRKTKPPPVRIVQAEDEEASLVMADDYAGRIPKGVKTARVNFVVPERLDTKWRKAAKNAGVSYSVWIRRRILSNEG